MASEVKTDKLSQRGSSGIVITDDIKLSSGKAIKKADGTALLTEAGALDNVALGGSVTGGPTQYVKAWVHFNGTGTVAVQKSHRTEGNESSNAGAPVGPRVT